uniref:Uncharacterized protein n=1 Tax=Trichuris muris TaxID=70415 RepID=A0A5S6QGD8_TRIMR
MGGVTGGEGATLVYDLRARLSAGMDQADDELFSSLRESQRQDKMFQAFQEVDSGYFSPLGSVSSYTSPPVYPGPVPYAHENDDPMLFCSNFGNALSPVNGNRGYFSSRSRDPPVQYDPWLPVQSTSQQMAFTDPLELPEGESYGYQCSTPLLGSEDCPPFTTDENFMVESNVGNYESCPIGNMEQQIEWASCHPSKNTNVQYFSSNESSSYDQSFTQSTAMDNRHQQWTTIDSNADASNSVVDIEYPLKAETASMNEVFVPQQGQAIRLKPTIRGLSSRVRRTLCFNGEKNCPMPKEKLKHANMEYSFNTPVKESPAPLKSVVKTPTPVKRAYAAAEKRGGKINRRLFVIPPADEDINELLNTCGIKSTSRSRRKCLFPYVYRGPEALYPAPLGKMDDDELAENWMEIATGATSLSKRMIHLAKRVLCKSQAYVS